MLWKTICGFILSCFALTIASNAEDRFRIDEDGNIILIEEREEKVEEEEEDTAESEQQTETEQSDSPPEETEDDENDGASRPQLKLPEEREEETSERQGTSEKPIPAIVSTRVAEVRWEPATDSRKMAQLRRGDLIEILEQGEIFSRIRFWIEDGFLLEGWIQTAAVQIRDSEAQAEPDPVIYEAPSEEEAREEKAEKKTKKPTQEFSDRIEGLPGEAESTEKSTLQDSDQVEARLATKPIDFDTLYATGQWLLSAHAALGLHSYSERLLTSEDGNYFDEPLLQYQLQGPSIAGEIQALRALSPNSLWRWGGQLNYRFSFITNEVGSDVTEIGNSRIFGQVHDTSVEALLSGAHPSFPSLRPEIGLSFHTQFFQVNQLKDQSKNMPVLFSHFAYYLQTTLGVEAKLPYHFVFHPRIGGILFYRFIEGPIQQTELGEIRTGNPSASGFQPNFEVEVSWPLHLMGWGQTLFETKFEWRKYRKEFKGEGNRAGMKMFDAVEESQSWYLQLGLRHHF